MESSQTNTLESYPIQIDLNVMWGEMDSFQHVNNIVYFRYFESARIEYFIQINALDYMEKKSIGPILAETHCKFKRPLKYPESIIVGAKVDQILEDRFWMKYAVFSKSNEKAAAEGTGLIVYYDYKEGKKEKIPESILSKIKSLENRD
jgi:acyl-CoA thioester hydrolase